MTIIIAKNNTVSAIPLTDLGVEIPGSGYRDLTDTFDLSDILESDDLHDNVSDGFIIINDGTTDLNISDGLKHINFETEYEDIQDITPGSIGIDISDGTSVIGVDVETLVFPNANLSGDSTSGIYINFTTEEVPVNVCQIRRTTTYTLPTAWIDITFDTTDVENNSNVLEHDTNTDRILIKETGYYEIELNTGLRNTVDTKQIFYRVRKNDTTVLIGSEFDVDLYQNETHELSRSFVTELQDGDFISLQMYTESNGGTSTLQINSSLLIKSLTALQGANGINGEDGLDGEDGLNGLPGPPGSGSTINVYENDSPFAINVDTLNFEGNVDLIEDSTGYISVQILGEGLDVETNNTLISEDVVVIDFSGNANVTEESSNNVKVEIPFGSEFQENIDDSESTTTSTSFQQKLRMTTSSLTSAYKYRIGWYYESQHRNRTTDFRGRVQINDTTTITEHRIESKDAGTDQWESVSGFYYLTGQSGIINIDLDYCSTNNANTSGIRRARLEIWRVS